MNDETSGFTAESDTLEHVNVTGGRLSRRPGYGALWRGVPRELGFLLLEFPIVMVGFALLHTLFWAGVGWLVLFVGLFFILAALYVARGFGTLELVRLRWAGRPEITRPQWTPPANATGFWRGVMRPLSSGRYWLYLLHSWIVNPAIATVTWSIALTWVATALGGTTYWFWGAFLPRPDHQIWLHDVILHYFAPNAPVGPNPFLGEVIFFFIVGVLFFATLPFVTHGLTLLHNVVARGLLGAWRSEALQREVADLSASRGAAVVAEDLSLRRLERDLHDGPQQRLIRLQMDLASAERKLDADPDAARKLLEEARKQAADTLQELRALSRGFAPPILQDRGLVAGLQSLAALSTVPVLLDVQLDVELRLPPEIERSAYYVAAELLTNVAKHANASAAGLTARLRREGDTDTTWLDLWVTDNGGGGASMRAGHGLRGLDERLRGLRGLLEVESPAGGPTRIAAHIPVTIATDAPASLS